ncbi:hypothetical protein ACJIZ3_020120 [Penstemon smallii]|uniref:Aspergillus nuclease S1 n=1 Tax=Penstemon smallii TaxID=265156 RepID=A0ABD3SHP5_9LAMI
MDQLCKIHIPSLIIIIALLLCSPMVHGWGVDGHLITCKIAQSRLSKAAADAVSQLLPGYASNDLSSLCSWADHVKFHGIPDRCVAGAINNYTNQLLTYNNGNSASLCISTTLPISLYWRHSSGTSIVPIALNSFMQPLHVGFTSDRGGNTIDVHWYTRKAVLHHVWDDSIIETSVERFYNSDVNELINTLQKNITTLWSNQAKAWETCSKTTCPDIYASEGIKAACAWAYKGVTEGSILEDDYFLSREPVVNLRLAQGGVRLAATLNRVFG